MSALVKPVRFAARPVRPRGSLHEEIASRVGTLISQGDLAPGSTLPNEAMLSAEFGVSRTVLREAMKVLASKGLIEVRRKIGTRVSMRAKWNMLDPEVLNWMFSGDGVSVGLSDLMEVRMLIEPPAARIAADKATAKDLDEIRIHLAGMESSEGKLRSSIEADLAFHMAILDATHNAFMKPFGALTEAALRGSFRLTSSNPELHKLTLPLHRRVFKAIEKKDGGKAEHAMKSLLTKTMQDIRMQAKAQQKKSPSRKLQRSR